MHQQLTALFCILAVFQISIAQPPKGFDTHFHQKWKVEIGKTAYRTNFLYHHDQLIVGSNGHHFRDWRLDEDNGVYIIDPLSGHIVKHFADEGLGDMDVCGVAALDDNLFFGNDNEEFFCYCIDGNLNWRVPVSGDVECAPVLMDIDQDGKKEVIVATETGEVAALDIEDGAVVWSFKIKSFSGWDKTDNRFLFKVGAFFRDGQGFMAPPAIAELNGDGIDDLIYNARDDYTYAIDGSNGTMLWRYPHRMYFIGYTPLVNGDDIYLVTKRKNKKDYYWEGLVSVNRKGKTDKYYPFSYHYAKEFTPVLIGDKLISAQYDTLVIQNIRTGYMRKKSIRYEYTSEEGYTQRNWNVVAQPKVMDFLQSGRDQIMVIDGHGVVQFLDTQTYQVIKTLMLPDQVESTPLIEDVDCDGLMEMVVGCNNGYLYCYDLPIDIDTFLSSAK